MENLEYLQLDVTYYSSVEGVTASVNEEGSAVWKGLKNYLDMLEIQGWVMIKETRSNREQARTYHLKRQIE